MRSFVVALAALCLLGAAPPAPKIDFARLLDETPAPKLSDYGLFSDGKPNPALTPYVLNAPLFSDYAEKERFVVLPPGKKAQYRVQGAFDFPVGAVLVKTFAYPADLRAPTKDVRWIETRLLIRKSSGWVAQAYLWAPDRSDAALKRAGARVDVSFIDTAGHTRHVDYAVPNQNQCKECHQIDKQVTPIGPKARNLNGPHAYATGAENQLGYWSSKGLLAGAPAPDKAPRTARWDDSSASLDARARAYIDANCAHCHQPRGIASNSGLFLNWEEPPGPHLGIGKRPVAAGRGSGGLEVSIAPGHPEASILAHRMASTEPGVMMPELGRSLVHEEGVELVRAWIKGMKAP